MAERTFDYDVAKQTYTDMQSTTQSIASVLDKANKAIDQYVQVEDEAIFGDLGSQLKTDWENSASCFPTFINRFGNWATLIAQSSGNYAEFEEQMKGFNPDGSAVAADGSGQKSAVAASFYNNYYSDNYDDYVNNGGTGAVNTSVIIPGVAPSEDGSADDTGATPATTGTPATDGEGSTQTNGGEDSRNGTGDSTPTNDGSDSGTDAGDSTPTNDGTGDDNNGALTPSSDPSNNPASTGEDDSKDYPLYPGVNTSTPEVQ